MQLVSFHFIGQCPFCSVSILFGFLFMIWVWCQWFWNYFLSMEVYSLLFTGHGFCESCDFVGKWSNWKRKHIMILSYNTQHTFHHKILSVLRKLIVFNCLFLIYSKIYFHYDCIQKLHSLLFFSFSVLKSEVDDLKNSLTSAESQLQVLKKEKNETNIEAIRKFAALESKVT